MLDIRGLHAWYGKSHVLHGVDLQVAPGEIACLLGRNGSGRSTLVRAAMGLVAAQGSVRWQGRELLGCPPHAIARAGLGYVPEQRDVFPTLTVEQNLLLGIKPATGPGRWSVADMYALFPQLESRRAVLAGVLSGGEQQMLALCRTLMGDPQLMMIDEPTEGLAPRIVSQIAAFLRTLAGRGVAVLLVEQKLSIALEVSHRAYVLGHGAVVFGGGLADLNDNKTILKEWLSV